MASALDRPPRLAVLQHADPEGPGLIATRARARGVELVVRRVHRGEWPPPLDAVDGVVAMGGPMSAADDARHPHLPAERALLRAALDRELPVLGICLGAQLLALAAGARLDRGVREDVRVGPVTVTAAGRADPVLGGVGERPTVLHWHEDGFELPDGAVLLATGEQPFPHQAFRLGPCAYGLQFHVEVDADHARAIRPALPPEVALTDAEQAAIERTGDAIAARFVELALARRAAG